MELLPREKLIKLGVKELSDDELLAIMLGTGSKEESVFIMSKRLIDEYGFERLYLMSYDELSKIPGIKEAKATKLMAVFEIVKRIMEATKSKRITNSKELFDYVYPYYLGINKEKLIVIYLASDLSVLKKEEFSDESFTRITTPIRTIVKKAIDNNCYGIFITHNHPGGNPNPSESDVSYTTQLEYALKAVDILLLDHLIISKNEFYSFSDNHKKGNPFDF